MIYRLDFSDGTGYVGQTRQTLDQRLRQHRMQPVNAAVHARMTSPTITCEISVLRRGLLPHEADRCEVEEIRRLARPLNRVIGGVFTRRGVEEQLPRRQDKGLYVHRRGRRQARTHRDTRCSTCREVRPAACFGSDASRFNGLNSRCRDCACECRKYMSRAVREGRTKSDGYRDWKATIPAARRHGGN